MTPSRETDSLYGAEFIVHTVEFAVPVDDECGAEAVQAQAEEIVEGRDWYLLYNGENKEAWIDEKGDHHGYLGSQSGSYGQEMMKIGFAHLDADAVPGNAGYLKGLEADTQAAGKGLWTTCPGFGA